MTERHFGYLVDRPDSRDYRLGHSAPMGADMTRSTDALHMLELHREVSRIRDQGRTSSCVGHAVVSAVEVRRALDGLLRVLASPLGAYWGARGLYGFAGEDAGAYIRGGMKWGQRVGFPTEQDWPMDAFTYAGTKGTKINVRPESSAEVKGAIVFSGGVYERITESGSARVQRVLDCLQSDIPVVFGTEVTEAFMDGNDTIPAPKPGERKVGGHAITALAFDRSGARVCIVNSWSQNWGSGGYGWLEAEWLGVPTTSDVWVLRKKAA